MNKVFLDTVGIIALIDDDDQWHLPASAAYAELRSSKQEVVTTSFVFLECGNAASRRPYRKHVAEMLQFMEQKNQIIYPTEADWHQAWRIYQRSHVGGPSIVDCISFEVMRRLGIREAFTNDRHFSDAGLVALF